MTKRLVDVRSREDGIVSGSFGLDQAPENDKFKDCLIYYILACGHSLAVLMLAGISFVKEYYSRSAALLGPVALLEPVVPPAQHILNTRVVDP